MSMTVERESYRIRREWSKTAAQNFRFRFPEHQVRLYEGADRFFVLVDVEESSFDELQAEFERTMRPVTCPVRLVREIDTSAVLVDEDQPYSAELWLNREPLTVEAMNSLLHLATPGLPAGGVDFNHELDSWVFKSPRELSADETDDVKSAMRKLGLNGAVLIEIFEPRPSEPIRLGFNASMKSDVLKISSTFSIHSAAARNLIARDEDLWRNFIDNRIDPGAQPVDKRSAQFSCLFDMSDRSDVRLSELLTIYDRVDIIPDRQNLNWLSKHGLSVDDLMQLVTMSRCRVILPYGAEHCRPDVLDGLASIGSMPPVLSRELAAKTFTAGQHKDPLLYGAFTAKQRALALNALERLGSAPALKALSASYGQMFARQHHAFMLNGAMASMNLGVGTHLGEMIARIRGVDARLELCTAGACVEWAMALGSSFIPRSFGEGYDETINSHLVASFMSRTFGGPVDPVSSRLHAITNGLLAVTGAPPLEVARNFNGSSVARFRLLARRLMHEAPTQAEMLECVERINDETRRFERRAERLTKWEFYGLGTALAGKGIGDAIDSVITGGIASVFAFWILDVLKKYVPSGIAEPLADLRETARGLALAPSSDALVVSRARAQLTRSGLLAPTRN